ncbi:TRAP transporter large permease subunit [Barnesiella sp. An55]|uniref:GntP family permease n=1 Tax=Barnesiella sp. An55 TaxID=1965646 RepID=UPI000B3693C1|nr:TRAP transporter large permease subunit [Barnesiella sp. An55]OUN73256.1 gluconate:proton symporter [Barnesiella sp. An55]HIZ25487.1 TRAP transporter large permease subunit [Candidatus Barnesiella merdipullorum]
MDSTVGALLGLLVAIGLIIKKVSPAYSLILGALIGGLAGGLSLEEVVASMTEGVKGVSSAVLRILTAGVLSGVLIKTGAAMTISNAIIRFWGEKRIYLALAFATMLLCAVGVFIDVAVITVAPVALSIGRRLGVPTPQLLLVMIGGGKCGNIISPNPNTIIAAENFGADLSSVMFANIIPALIGLLFTVFIIVRFFPVPERQVQSDRETVADDQTLPPLWSSLVAPVVTILLLALRPLCGITVDPLIALPVGGLCGLLCMKQWKNALPSIEFGLQKMSVIAVLLIGTGTIAGVIQDSTLKDHILALLDHISVGKELIAPVSGILMSAATASTTAGATLASASFADTILAVGVSSVWGAAMVNAGSTVLDHLPHGSFFHATGGVCELSFRERLKLIPYESLIGAVLTLCSTLMYWICR